MAYTIREYGAYCAEEILPLYASVGRTAYTDQPETLAKGFAYSLLTLAAYDGERLVGLVRVVGDGHTIIWIQDLLVRPEDQRRGIGTALLRAVMQRYAQVRQIELATDDTPKTAAFYRAAGFAPMEALGCRGFMRV